MASKHFTSTLARLALRENGTCRFFYCAISLILLALTTYPAFAQVCNRVYGSVTVNPNLVLLAEPGPMNGDILTNGNLQIQLGIGYLNTQGTANSGFGRGISIFSDGTPSKNELYRQATRDPNVFNYVYPDGSKEVHTGVLLSSLTDVLGKTTTITYRPGTTIPTSITGPDGTTSTTFEVTDVNVGYQRREPRITKVSDASGDYVTCNYDMGDLTSIVDKAGSALFTLQREASDPRAVTSVITPEGRTDIFYEKKDRGSAAAVVKIIYPDRSGITYSRSQTVQQTGGRTQTTENTVITTPNENCGFRDGIRTKYVYDAVFNRLNELWRDSSTGYKKAMSWSYDTFGRVTVEDDRDSSTFTQYSYRPYGNNPLPETVTKTVPTANTIEIPSGLVQVKSDYTYSTDWKVLSIKNTYTPVTMVSSASRPTTPIGTTEERYSYDSSGRLTKVTSLGNDTVTSSTSYTYQGNSRLPSSSSATETSTIDISSRGIVTKVTQPSGLSTEFQTTATSSIRKSMGFAETIAFNRGASGNKTYTFRNSSGTTTTSGNETSSTLRGGMTLRASTAFSGTSTITTDSCSSPVDACSTEASCTPDRNNPENCTWTTREVCTNNCIPRQCTTCGASDGCGRLCQTGSCPAGGSCQGGVCRCNDSCSGKTCGLNGCGRSCGACSSGSTCNASGQCVANPRPAQPQRPPQPPPVCRPACPANSCGGWDGCGNTCGCTGGATCVAGRCQSTAIDPGRCIPADPRVGGGNFCNGSAGYVPVVDPTGTTCTCVRRQT